MLVITDELQTLFDLRDHRTKLLEKVDAAELEVRKNRQHYDGKDAVEVHDLELTHKCMRTLSDARNEFAATNQEFEHKKNFFIDLIEATGCRKLACSNKEWHHDGRYEYVHYNLVVEESEDGRKELLMRQL